MAKLTDPVSRKVYNVGFSLAITIPANMVEKMGIIDGDELTLVLEEKSKGKFISVYKEKK